MPAVSRTVPGVGRSSPPAAAAASTCPRRWARRRRARRPARPSPRRLPGWSPAPCALRRSRAISVPAMPRSLDGSSLDECLTKAHGLLLDVAFWLVYRRTNMDARLVTSHHEYRVPQVRELAPLAIDAVTDGRGDPPRTVAAGSRRRVAAGVPGPLRHSRAQAARAQRALGVGHAQAEPGGLPGGQRSLSLRRLRMR